VATERRNRHEHRFDSINSTCVNCCFLDKTQYGRHSERFDADQMQLVLEDTETAVAERAAQTEKTAAPDLAT